MTAFARLQLIILAGALGLIAATAAQAQSPRPPVKYTLMIMAGGIGADPARRDGVALGGAGIFMGREECEAAGAGVRFGIVSQGEGQPPPTIVWICVPLNKP